jgi:peptidoglycan/xylan/chitin deacetylase (PgdA/CDA1 family)
VMWTTDSLGWEGLPAASIVSRVLAQATPGAILLMHVGAQSQDALALPRVIAGLKSRGYRLVTIPQLLAGR